MHHCECYYEKSHSETNLVSLKSVWFNPFTHVLYAHRKGVAHAVRSFPRRTYFRYFMKRKTNLLILPVDLVVRRNTSALIHKLACIHRHVCMTHGNVAVRKCRCTCAHVFKFGCYGRHLFQFTYVNDGKSERFPTNYVLSWKDTFANTCILLKSPQREVLFVDFQTC